MDRHRGGQRALLLQVSLPGELVSDQLEELQLLAESAGLEVVDSLQVKRQRLDPAFLIGRGKVNELAQRLSSQSVDVLIINFILTPAQTRNIEREVDCLVIDRTGLILDIFAKRAQSFEGKLQVELAQLNYLASRLRGGWTHLERQKGGIGLRGPGETQLEADRRWVAARIKRIRAQLLSVSQRRTLARQARERSDVTSIGLVGYTNAGKSTLFNALTAATAYVQDQLFATLDPTIRALSLPGLGETVLVDTVGFVRDLPHELIAAFRATLEETLFADLLVHVVDAHDLNQHERMQEVNAVLAEMGADKQASILVFNKIDLCENLAPGYKPAEEGVPARVWLSAKTGEGLELLQQAISEQFKDRMRLETVELAPSQAGLRSSLYEKGAVLSEELLDSGGWRLRICLLDREYARLFDAG